MLCHTTNGKVCFFLNNFVLGDLYVHADLHGASSVVIKNPSGEHTHAENYLNVILNLLNYSIDYASILYILVKSTEIC